MHPFMDITAEETPVLSNFRRRQLTDSGELIDGRLRDPEKPSHLQHGQNFTFPCAGIFGLNRCCGSYFIIHDD